MILPVSPVYNVQGNDGFFFCSRAYDEAIKKFQENAMDHVERLEHTAVYILREAYARYPRIALLWSMGKDSTVLVWLARKAFFGRIPFPIIHIDTSYKFPEMYRFRDEYAQRWGLRVIVSRNEAALAQQMNPAQGHFHCCDALKTQALKQTVDAQCLQALLLAIRKDEHGIRAKERYFSPRDRNFRWDYEHQPPELWELFRSSQAVDHHVRVHPLLGWTELDVWRYVQREKIPVVSLYFARGGQRYRSIGCACCCQPTASAAVNVGQIIRELLTTTVAERSGRAQDKEDSYTMQKLRSLGYM